MKITESLCATTIHFFTCSKMRSRGENEDLCSNALLMSEQTKKKAHFINILAYTSWYVNSISIQTEKKKQEQKRTEH